MDKNALRALPALILALTAAGLTATAAPLTPTQALNRVYEGRHKAPGRLPQARSMELVLTQDLPDASDAACYLFASRDGRGYMLVSADDAAVPLLGYSAEGSIDPASMPPAMRYWLECYSREIEAAASAGRRAPSAAPEGRGSRKPIEVLTTTLWNQGAPYNNMCPDVDGGRAVTGCVATALAQVMRYHSWPGHGQGSNSYALADGSTVAVNFADTYFDWDEMLDDYGRQVGTTSQTDAVATLMHACGAAVDMQYGRSESSAQALAVPAAMVKYFNYDRGVRYLPRDYYGLYDWEDLVYDQLATYGPVQYSGQSNEGGHSFVCDGYSSDGYFHINWGWGGMSDGYFLLTALDPAEQGIGGSLSGFNYDQSIIACVARPSATPSAMYENVLLDGDFAIEPLQAEAGSAVIVSGPVYNFSIDALSGTLGLKITPAMTDGTTAVYAEGTRFDAVAPAQGLRAYQATLPAGLADGDYIVSPAFRGSSGEWKDIPVKISNASSARMSVSGGVCTFADMAGTEVTVTRLKATTPVYLGCDFRLTARVSNPSADEEFYGVIAAVLVDPSANTPLALGANFSVDLMAGESEDIEYVSVFDRFISGSAPAPGAYKIYFVDTATGRVLSEGIDVDLKAEPADTVIAVTGLTLAGGRSTDVDKSQLAFAGTVDCTEGYFGGTLTVAIFPYPASAGEQRSVATFTSEPVFVEAGFSARFTAVGDFADGEEDCTYMAAVFQGQTQVSSAIIFTLGSDKVDVRGIDGSDEIRLYPNPVEGQLYVESGSPVLSLSVYSAVGAVVGHNRGEAQIDMSSLPSGVYFVEVDTEAAGKSIYRIIKK